MKDVLEKFWGNVDQSGECFIWIGTRSTNRYGSFWYNGKAYKAHRFIYEHTYGVFDYSLYVYHKCDNGLCVKPDHLFLGDQLANMTDMKLKGRADRDKKKGALNGRAKLTSDQVAFIRLNYIYGSKEFGTYGLGRKFGVSATCILDIVKGQAW